MAKSTALLPGQVSQPRTVWYDLDRLAELRDRHAALVGRARAARAAVVESTRVLASARATAASHPVAVKALSGPASALSKLTVGELTAIQVSSRDIQRIQVADKRHSRLSAEANVLIQQVRQSNEFMAQLEAYVKAKNL